MKKTLLLLVLILFITPSAFPFGACDDAHPKGIAYLPKVKQCGGTAAVAVWGDLYNSFSIVVRDCNNNDRDPCHKQEGSCATNQSSPFKTQKILTARLRYSGKSFGGRVHCLKESGFSEVYKLVRRITVKKVNPVRSPGDLLKLCLRSRTKASRGVRIVSVSSVRKLPTYGWTSVCATQGYLNCPIGYSDICPKY